MNERNRRQHPLNLSLNLKLATAMALATALSGCSVLVGNVRPVEEPAPVLSEKKGAESLLASPWHQVDSSRKETAAPVATSGSVLPELNFQNEETGSTLAFTSGCRASYRKSSPALRSIAQSLGSGLSRIQKREQDDTDIRQGKGLRTTLIGWAGGSEVVVHNVLMSRGGCVFDLTLVSLQRHFDGDRPAFDKLLAALPLP